MNGTNKTKDVDPIDEFLAMSNSTDASSLRILVQRVLSHPKVFAGFAELLSMPNIRSLQFIVDSNEETKFNQENQAIWNTLELFAYGTIIDYINAPEHKYLKLTSIQEYKLRQLSIVSLIQSPDPITKSRRAQIPYHVIQDEIFSSSISSKSPDREIEDMIISCIYSNLITGKLDQKNKMFLVTQSAPTTDDFSQSSSLSYFVRDVPLSSIPSMIAKLDKWRNKSNTVIHTQLEQTMKKNQDMTNGHIWMWKQTTEKMSDMRSAAHGAVAKSTASTSTSNSSTTAKSGGIGSSQYRNRGNAHKAKRKGIF